MKKFLIIVTLFYNFSVMCMKYESILNANKNHILYKVPKELWIPILLDVVTSQKGISDANAEIIKLRKTCTLFRKQIDSIVPDIINACVQKFTFIKTHKDCLAHLTASPFQNYWQLYCSLQYKISTNPKKFLYTVTNTNKLIKEKKQTNKLFDPHYSFYFFYNGGFTLYKERHCIIGYFLNNSARINWKNKHNKKRLNLLLDTINVNTLCRTTCNNKLYECSLLEIALNSSLPVAYAIAKRMVNINIKNEYGRTCLEELWQNNPTQYLLKEKTLCLLRSGATVDKSPALLEILSTDKYPTKKVSLNSILADYKKLSHTDKRLKNSFSND